MSDLDLSPRQLLVEDASRTIDATVVPLEYRHPILAAEFADALLHMRRTLSLADGTLYHYRRTIEKPRPSEPPRGLSPHSVAVGRGERAHQHFARLGGVAG